MIVNKTYEIRHNKTLTTGLILDIYEKGLLKGVLLIDDDYNGHTPTEITMKIRG